MRAKHLIEELQKLNPNTIVFCQDSTTWLHSILTARNASDDVMWEYVPLGIMVKHKSIETNWNKEFKMLEDMHNYKV
jgi:hypothetical protein